MKIKSVLAAVAATAVLATGSAVAFAESAEDGEAVVTADEAPTEGVDGASDETNVTADGESTEAETENTEDSDANTDTGVEGVAAVVGVVALAGAAVVISRKRA